MVGMVGMVGMVWEVSWHMQSIVHVPQSLHIQGSQF